jgi:hypothetical protein
MWAGKVLVNTSAGLEWGGFAEGEGDDANINFENARV